MNTYKNLGFDNRYQYLQHLSEEYGVDMDEVIFLANNLGAEEDFDGLVVALEDYIN